MDDQIQYLDDQIRSSLVQILSDMMEKHIENQLEYIATSLDRLAQVKKLSQLRPNGDSPVPCTESFDSCGLLPASKGDSPLHSQLEALCPELRELISPYIMRLSEWEPESQLEQFALLLETDSITVGR